MTIKKIDVNTGEVTVDNVTPVDEFKKPTLTPTELNAKADADAETQFGDSGDPKLKAVGLVMADLAVAAGVAPNLASARQEVKTRWRNYYRQLLTTS